MNTFKISFLGLLIMIFAFGCEKSDSQTTTETGTMVTADASSRGDHDGHDHANGSSSHSHADGSTSHSDGNSSSNADGSSSSNSGSGKAVETKDRDPNQNFKARYDVVMAEGKIADPTKAAYYANSKIMMDRYTFRVKDAEAANIKFPHIYAIGDYNVNEFKEKMTSLRNELTAYTDEQYALMTVSGKSNEELMASLRDAREYRPNATDDEVVFAAVNPQGVESFFDELVLAQTLFSSKKVAMIAAAGVYELN